MIHIPKSATIIGELRCEGATRVDARIEGEGIINGILLISASCVWIGKITADKIIVEGTVIGQLIARKNIQISAKAKLTGKISAPEMRIAKGAQLNCDINIAKIRIPAELNKVSTSEKQRLHPFETYPKIENTLRKTHFTPAYVSVQ